MQKNIQDNDGVSLDRAAATKKERNIGIGKIVVLAVLLLAVGAFFVQRRLNADIDPAAFLPADTLVYIDQHQVEQRGQRFLASPLGKAATSIDLPALLRDLDAPMDAQADLQEKIGDIKDFLHNKITTELLGDRFLVAVLPRRDWMKETAVSFDFRKHLVLLCKPRHGAAAMDLLTSIYSGNLESEVVPYGGHTLKRFKNDKFSFIACVAGGWLLAAFEERGLRETLDAFDAGANSLATNEGFKKIVASLPAESEQIVYLRFSSFTELMKDASAPTPRETALLKQFEDVVAGLDVLAYGSWMRAGLSEERLLMSFIPDKATGTVKKLLTTPPSKDELLPYLRENLMWYCYNGVNDWPAALDGLEPEQRAVVEAFSGHSAQELRQMLGDGPSRLFMRQGEGGQTLPLPSVNFCMTAVEPEKLSDIASTLLARAGIEMSKGKFQDASYQVWNKGPEKNLRFYSALWHGQWCLGNSLDFFKEIAERSPAGESLLAAEAFHAIDNGINQPAHSLLYVRVDQFVDLLHDASNWLATILAMKDKDLSAKAKLVNERVIFPLLTGAKMYRRYLSRSVVENNMLRLDSRTSIGPAIEPVESK